MIKSTHDDARQSLTLTMDRREAEAISTALAHVWREVMDRNTARGSSGAILRDALNHLNKVTESRR